MALGLLPLLVAPITVCPGFLFDIAQVAELARGAGQGTQGEQVLPRLALLT